MPESSCRCRQQERRPGTLDAHLDSCPACVGALTGGILLRNALRELNVRENAEAFPAPEPRLSKRLVEAMMSAKEAGESGAARRLA